MALSIHIYKVQPLFRRICQDAGLSMDEVTSKDVQSYFIENKIHAVRDYPEFFSFKPPDVAVTYQWPMKLKFVNGSLNFVPVFSQITA